MPNSVQHWLDWGCQQLAGHSDSAQLDSEVLLCHCLQKTRSYLRTWPDAALHAQHSSAYQQVIQQRQGGLPVAYLLGEREFWSRPFTVSPEVLIPRPDSELLIERALQHIAPQQSARLIDLGTGSGMLAITLAAERPQLSIIAVDQSPAALAIAQANAARHGVQQIEFIHSDWFAAVPAQHFDIVLSNPPYIDPDDPHLQQGDVRFEPRAALVSADKGLHDLTRIADHARHYLADNGLLLLEHGYNQAPALLERLSALNYQHIACHTDLAGNPRVTAATWNRP